MGGIAEVARVAGVSKSTASRALTGNGYVSPATRERVARVAEDLGYVASSSASSLATGRTRNIGVVMPYLNRWFFAAIDLDKVLMPASLQPLLDLFCLLQIPCLGLQ